MNLVSVEEESYMESRLHVCGCCYPREVIIPGGAHGVMVIVAGNGHGDTSSNPGREWLHFT